MLLTPVTGGGGGRRPTTPAPPAPTPGRDAAAPGRDGAPPGGPAAGPQFTAYRAAIGPLKLNKKRSSLKFTLTCASTAPKGCLVKVSAKIAGKSVDAHDDPGAAEGQVLADHGDALQEHDAPAEEPRAGR